MSVVEEISNIDVRLLVVANDVDLFSVIVERGLSRSDVLADRS